MSRHELFFGKRKASSLRRTIPGFQEMRVRRNLFGVVDHKAADELLTHQLSFTVQSASQYWNFDFATEIPRTGGRFVWEVVTSTTPQIYNTQLRLKEKKASCEEKVKNPESFGDEVRYCDLKNQRSPKSKSKSQDENRCGPLLIQTTLKGFLPVKKRMSHLPTCNKRFLRSTAAEKHPSKQLGCQGTVSYPLETFVDTVPSSRTNIPQSGQSHLSPESAVLSLNDETTKSFKRRACHTVTKRKCRREMQ